MEREIALAQIEGIAAQLFRDTEKMEGQPDNYVYTYRLTSIDVLEFLLAVESEFGFELDDADLTEQTLMDRNKLLDIVMNVAGERVIE